MHTLCNLPATLRILAVDIAGAFRLNIAFDSDYSNSASAAFIAVAANLTDGVSARHSGFLALCALAAVYHRLTVLPHILSRKSDSRNVLCAPAPR